MAFLSGIIKAENVVLRFKLSIYFEVTCSVG